MTRAERTLLWRVLPWVVAATSAACGGGGDSFAPEFLDVSALSGTYQVTLTPDPASPPRTCGRLQITMAAQITWQGLDCTVRPAGGARDAGGGLVMLSETVDVAGGGTTTRQAHAFGVFMGTASRPGSSWIGPCPDAAVTCSAGLREYGSADWVRQ
jgi:hypothetical protein